MVSAVAEAPQIRLDRDELCIGFEPLFGAGQEAQARSFARRAFLFPEVTSLNLKPAQSEAIVRFRVGESDRKSFVGRLAAAIGDSSDSLPDELLPSWPGRDEATLCRFGELITLFEVARTGPGRLQLRHPAIQRDPALGGRLESAVKALNGVTAATATASAGRLWVVHLPESTDIADVIRTAEAQLASPRTALAAVPAAETPLVWANTALGLAAVGELAVPAVLPVCIGMLVINNIGTVRDAGRQLSRGKIGLPVLHTALLGCSITTGQIVAHALMEWSFKFWARRSRVALADECRSLLEEQLPIPAEARLVRSEEVEALVPSGSLQPGQRIRIAGPAPIPVDGRVTDGAALIEEISITGTRTPVRKLFGDEVFAGSTVVAGALEIEVLSTGADTRAAAMARTLINAARELHQDPWLLKQAEAMADRPVVPTLATAGVGYAVGSLFTVGAILHQDYMSGPALAVPLEAFRDMSLALRTGAIVRTASALPRLGESRFVVLDDHPALTESGLELERLESNLAESETDRLLGYVAGAGLYLGDARAAALSDACRDRGIVVRRPPLASLDGEQVTVKQGTHALTLVNEPDNKRNATAAPALRVHIDGVDVAWLRFRPGSLPLAAPAVRRLRSRRIPVFLLSDRPAAETEQRAARLGTDLFGGDFSAEQKFKFLEGLQRRGVLATYIGPAEPDSALAQAAHVSVALNGAGSLDERQCADLVLAGDSLESFADLMEWAASYGQRVQGISRKAVLPNLLCIAGAFGGVLNGTTAGLIANTGVYRSYRQARNGFREIRDAQGTGWRRVYP